MMGKITLEQFKQIRKQLADLIQKFTEGVDAHKKDENFDEVSFEKEIIEEYIFYQNQLLSYDLSDIPFEEWQDFTIFSDDTHIADFSKTKANIDFAIVEYFGNGNFKGCNVRNLDSLGNVLNAKDFDEQTLRANPSLFLTDIFSEEFKDKYYSQALGISDLASLSSEQIEELTQKTTTDYEEYNSFLIKAIGIDKAVQLYKHSQQEYEAVNQLIKLSHSYGFVSSRNNDLPSYEEFLEQLQSTDVSDLKNVCFEFARKYITDSYLTIKVDDYPELFIYEHADIFLLGANIPEEVKNRYYEKRLSIQDLIDYPEVFQNIPIDYFMAPITMIHEFCIDNYGRGEFQKLVQKHPDVFEHIQERNQLFEFNKLLKESKDLEWSFTRAVKNYFLNYGMPEQFRVERNGKIEFNVPHWLSSMNFQFVDRLNSVDDLLQYNESVVVVNSEQRRALDMLNIDNIRKFDEEIGFFTHKTNTDTKDLEGFDVFCYYLRTNKLDGLAELGIDFKDGQLSYEEFSNQMAKCLDNMRKKNIFTDYPDYDWIQGQFRNEHPEIFMDLDAPDELKQAFYKNKITPDFLYKHKECIPYLINRNLFNTINADIKLSVPGMVNVQGHIIPHEASFIEEYASRYGNEKLLQLISKYGNILSDIDIKSFHNEIEDEKTIEQALKNAIYNKIIKTKVDYSYLSEVPEMLLEHPELFINLDDVSSITLEEKQNLIKAFYNRRLTFDDIKNNPELVNILKDKNLFVAFGYKDGIHKDGRILVEGLYYKEFSDLELLEIFGNEKFLQLCAKYGKYMNSISKYLTKDVTIIDGKYFDKRDINLERALSFEEITKKIEEIIVRECKLGNIKYLPSDAPQFLIENHPELFLSNDAPEELKTLFYNGLTFKSLQQLKNWLPFLEGKAIKASLLKDTRLKPDLIKFFGLFGEEKAIKLGINRPETVTAMLESHQVELMKSWYDKTGGSFIPDFVVMQNFCLEEADKFLLSGSNWSNLMKIKNFAATPEARDAMLKLAYSFGVFDQDQRGFKKLQDLLTSLPKKIEADKGYIFERLDSLIIYNAQPRIFFPKKAKVDEFGFIKYESIDITSEEKEEAYNKMIEHVKSINCTEPLNGNNLVNLLESLKKENVDIDFSEPIFEQLYRKNEDGTYSLTINSQSCPKSAQAIRTILEQFRELPILTPDKAHQLFGAFELKYDPEFREFLLANMDMENWDYIRFISSVQRQFSEIKAVNSNRTLTWELAVSYVQTNKYTSVNVGNERVAEISSMAGYSQKDFEVLQQIYNYGKQRTFSSIPRIERTTEKGSGKYTYEILRLDDPLAMAIGTLTDCCQELNNVAETCMEHSMVDKNGRVFVIKDDQGNIVAQSWVWRNKDVLCFDNIEIPDKAFIRASKGNSQVDRKKFTDEIFEIYKQAAQELIELDEKVYRELLENGKITQEQYDGLRLGKVTVGLGYNDIAVSLKENSKVDEGEISRPLPFEAPVTLPRKIYTSDSNTQYILEARSDRKSFDGETLSVHNDDYIEYTDSNFTKKHLLTLGKLELITKEYIRVLDTSISDFADEEKIVSELATNYGLNPETTKIVMNPNFAIIYEINGDKVKVADLLFNTVIDNEQQTMDIEKQVVMQIKLAFEQIAGNKEIDVSMLNEKQRKMYLKVTGLTDEIDIERGISNAK